MYCKYTHVVRNLQPFCNFLGQFSQPFDKRQPYETDIRVPLIVRGPGIDPNIIRFDPIVNVDLAPTILKIAGVEINNSMDGIPLPIFNDSKRSLMEPSIETNDVTVPDQYDRQILIEYHGEGSNTPSSDCPSNDTNLFVSFSHVAYINKLS